MISISVHAIVESMQSAHGIGHDDFKQYHEFCTRRLSRLRHNREVRKEMVHSAAYVVGEKMKRHVYCPRSRPAVMFHENQLLETLVEAERAWAHASELKSLLHERLPKSHEKANCAPGRIRQHSVRRLRRARQLAIDFRDLCGEFADETTRVEAAAYAAWMSGNLALELNDWKTACHELQSSIAGCQKLAEIQDDLEMADIFTMRASNVLMPLLKYSMYELKEAGGDTSGVEETHEQEEKSRKSAISGAVVFRGKQIEIDSRDLKVLLLKAESLGTDSSVRNDEENFISLLSIYDDALSMVANDIKKYNEMKTGPAVQRKLVNLNLLSGYIRFQKLQLSMSHHEKMIEQCHGKTADCAHLYDALLQDAQGICDLPGPEEDDEFYLQAMANQIRIRAFRAFFTAHVYADMNKFPEALALLHQSEKLARRASEEIAACDEMNKGDLYLESLDNLASDIGIVMVRIQAQSYLGTACSTTPPVGGDLLSLLKEFKANTNLTEIHPIPAPAKPSFFDLAWDQASSFPEEELQTYIEENKQTPATGLLGWFRGA